MLENNYKIIRLYIWVFIVFNRLFNFKRNKIYYRLDYLSSISNNRLTKTLSYLFLFDLFLRFPKSNLKYFRKLKKRRYFLPVLANLHLVKNFIKFSGLKFLIGNKVMLPMFISNVSIFSPLLALRSRKSF